MVKWLIAALSSRSIGKVGLLITLGLLLAGCTGRGGGWLPPGVNIGDLGITFNDQATFGFSFSCERSSKSSNTNPPTGQLRIALSYSEKSTNLLGGPFSIHGEADTIDPVVESAVCIGQNPPPGGNELIFLGTYRPTSYSSGSELKQCDKKTPECQFEVIVRDNDNNYAPSKGDFFSIKLSGTTTANVTANLAGPLIYTRAGLLGGGNIEVD